jgi:predicted metal-dependent hydrolase
MTRRRGCHTSRLRRRYGCFRLPRVLGARIVKAAARSDVGWLARTDPGRKEVEFSQEWNRLLPEEKRYIVLHERAHLTTGPDHNEKFYTVLKGLIEKHHMPWKVAYELEQWNCHQKH